MFCDPKDKGVSEIPLGGMWGRCRMCGGVKGVGVRCGGGVGAGVIIPEPKQIKLN